jgi:hypothetical protein
MPDFFQSLPSAQRHNYPLGPNDQRCNAHFAVPHYRFRSGPNAERRRSGGVEAESSPEKVDVEPVAADSKISQRLRSILSATGWFSDIKVVARNGVVFLDGLATWYRAVRERR